MQAFAASRSVSRVAVAAARSFETISLAQEQVDPFPSTEIPPGEYIESDIDSSYWSQRIGPQIVQAFGVPDRREFAKNLPYA
jgi:hypothetical protein